MHKGELDKSELIKCQFINSFGQSLVGETHVNKHIVNFYSNKLWGRTDLGQPDRLHSD